MPAAPAWRPVPTSPTRQRALALAAGCLALFTVFRLARMEGWDDAFYLAQLTSVVGDGDLLLQDDLLAMANPLPVRLRSVVWTTASGAPVNTFSIGPAVIHSSYLWPLVRRGAPPGGAFRAGIALGSMALLVLTVVMTAELLREAGFEGWPQRLAAALPVLWGPLALYGTRSYLNAHLPSAACLALLLWSSLCWCRAGRVRHALTLGLAAGVLVITRWQDALLLAAIGPAVFGALRADGPGRRRRALGLAAGAALGAAALAVQGLALRAQFGRVPLVPQGEGYMAWTRPALAAFVASPFHGLLPWAPGFAVALGGLALLLRHPRPDTRRLAAGLLLALPVFVYVCAAPRDWWGGDSFGPRRLASLTPAAGLGLAALLRALRGRAAATLVLAASVWAVVVASAFLSGFDDLAVLLGGAPSASNPHPAARYDGLKWIDRWGALHYLKPGFTFKDAPRDADRLVGVAAVAMVVGLTWAGWRVLRRHAALQRAALGCAAAWLGVWVVLVARVPPNAAADRAWLQVVRGHEPADALPADVRAAAQLVLAFHAAREGRAAEAERRLREASRGPFPAPSLDELEGFARSPAAEALLEEARP